MHNRSMDNKNIIQSKGIIDENCKIISADEEFYRFVGPNISLITDAIHQVDIDDFIYVLENLNPFAPKSMVIRIRRFDNTFRWCLATITKSDVEIEDKIHINVELSDILNLNNHYLALTKAINTQKSECKYENLIDNNEFLERARVEIDEVVDNQVNLFCIGIDNYEDIISNFGQDFYQKMLDEVSTELVEFVGERGDVARSNEGQFMIMLKNVGSESNLRSFIESTRSKIRWMYVSKNSALNINFTIATSEYPRNGGNFDIIHKKLVRAYEYGRNNKGGNCYVIYKEEIHGEI